jgi:hypothetical protein
MSNRENIVKLILKRLKNNGFSQVDGYNRFQFISELDKAVILLREKGTKARVPFSKIIVAIEAVKRDPSVYDAGPSALRAYGITHINSPIWSLLHLLTKAELTE